MAPVTYAMFADDGTMFAFDVQQPGKVTFKIDRADGTRLTVDVNSRHLVDIAFELLRIAKYDGAPVGDALTALRELDDIASLEQAEAMGA